MSQSSPLEIVIAGGGTAGWVAAATFARFLGNRASITLVESDEIGTVGVGEATIPQIHNLIVGLGLDQADFLRRTNATFKLGIEFADWPARARRYIHSFGTTGRGVGLIPFRQLWLRGARSASPETSAITATISSPRGWAGWRQTPAPAPFPISLTPIISTPRCSPRCCATMPRSAASSASRE